MLSITAKIRMEQRTLAKVSYRIHTKAIKENLIPKE